MQEDGVLNRRQLLWQAGAAVGLAGVLKSAEASVPIDNKRGNFRFLKGSAPYSSGAAAAKGYDVVHATLVPAPPYRKGFEIIDRHLREQRRPPQSLCGIELRSPHPMTVAGFGEFNAGYLEMLKKRDLLVEGLNPVARTNVAPEVDPPSEVALYGFSYTAPARSSQATFVIAGAGELRGEAVGPEAIVRRGDVSPGGLREKAAHVLGVMEKRLKELEVDWGQATTVQIYTVHDIFPLMQKLLLPRLGAAKIHGVRWHFARPPIVEIEFEMDVRGCSRELVIAG